MKSIIRLNVFITRHRYCVLLFFLFFLIFSFNKAFSQKSKEKFDIVEGTAIIPMTCINTTRFMYRALATGAAQDNALKDKYSTSVLDNYMSFEKIVLEGKRILEMEEFRGIYKNHFPNGTWVQDIDTPKCNEIEKENKFYMSCTVKGYARKIETTTVAFTAETLRDGTSYPHNIANDFNNNNQLYMYFVASVDGYLLICYSDFQNVFRLFPHDEMNVTKFRVKANEPYILFSEKHAHYVDDKRLIREMITYNDKDTRIAFNQIYILFSNSDFNPPTFEIRPYDKNSMNKPRSTSQKNYVKWLQEQRLKNSDLQVDIKYITVRRRD